MFKNIQILQALGEAILNDRTDVFGDAIEEKVSLDKRQAVGEAFLFAIENNTDALPQGIIEKTPCTFSFKTSEEKLKQMPGVMRSLFSYFPDLPKGKVMKTLIDLKSKFKNSDGVSDFSFILQLSRHFIKVAKYFSNAISSLDPSSQLNTEYDLYHQQLKVFAQATNKNDEATLLILSLSEFVRKIIDKLKYFEKENHFNPVTQSAVAAMTKLGAFAGTQLPLQQQLHDEKERKDFTFRENVGTQLMSCLGEDFQKKYPTACWMVNRQGIAILAGALIRKKATNTEFETLKKWYIEKLSTIVKAKNIEIKASKEDPNLFTIKVFNIYKNPPKNTAQATQVKNI